MNDNLIQQLTNLLLAFDGQLKGTDENGAPAVGDDVVRWDLSRIGCVVSIDNEDKQIELISSKSLKYDLVSRLHRTLQKFATYSNYTFKHSRVTADQVGKPSSGTLETDSGTTGTGNIASVTMPLMSTSRKVSKKVHEFGLHEEQAINQVAEETGYSRLLISELYSTNFRPQLQESIYGKYNRTSYQRIGDSRLVIKHKKNVNNGVVGGRSRNIGAIFLETPIGKYTVPTHSLYVARCYAKHVDRNGPGGAHKILEAELDMNALRKLSKVLKESNPTASKSALEAALVIKKKFEESMKGKPVSFTPINDGFHPHQELIGLRARLNLDESYDKILEAFVKYNCQEALDYKPPYIGDEQVDHIMDQIIARIGHEFANEDIQSAAKQLLAGELDAPISQHGEKGLEYFATHSNNPVIAELCKWAIYAPRNDSLIKLLRVAAKDNSPIPVREYVEFENWLNETSDLSIQMKTDKDFNSAVKMLSQRYKFDYDRLARRINFSDMIAKNAARELLNTNGFDVAEGFLPIDYDFDFDIRRKPRMRAKELYEDDAVTGNERQIIKKRANRLAQSILSGANGRDYSSVNAYLEQQSDWSDAAKQFFKTSVDEFLQAHNYSMPDADAAVNEPEVNEPETANAEVPADVPVGEPAVEPTTDEPEMVNDEPAEVKARRTKLVKKGGNDDGSMNVQFMESLGYVLYGADDVDSAPRRSQQSDFVKEAVKEGRTFNWNGHSYTIIGVFGNPTKMNKAVFVKDDDSVHVYLTGEKLAMDVLGKRRQEGKVPANLERFLHGMVKVSNQAPEEPNVAGEDAEGNEAVTEMEGTSMLERKLAVLDAIDSQLGKGNSAETEE